ncbi:hypothetical protein VMA_001082 [Vibrio mimicus VM223]|nr:hypothetical protein VMA_001082 [Vibrio mimicus VM223]
MFYFINQYIDSVMYIMLFGFQFLKTPTTFFAPQRGPDP